MQIGIGTQEYIAMKVRQRLTRMDPWWLKDSIAFRVKFSRQAFRDRFVRKHLAELVRQELETYSSGDRLLDATDGVPAARLEIVALALLAVALGLGILAVRTDAESEHLHTEAATLVPDCVAAFQLSQLGQLQC